MIAFFESPGYVMINGSRRLADLWVHYVDLRALVILIESEIDRSVPAFPCDDDERELRLALGSVLNQNC